MNNDIISFFTFITSSFPNHLYALLLSVYHIYNPNSYHTMSKLRTISLNENLSLRHMHFWLQKFALSHYAVKFLIFLSFYNIFQPNQVLKREWTRKLWKHYFWISSFLLDLEWTICNNKIVCIQKSKHYDPIVLCELFFFYSVKWCPENKPDLESLI